MFLIPARLIPERWLRERPTVTDNYLTCWWAVRTRSGAELCRVAAGNPIEAAIEASKNYGVLDRALADGALMFHRLTVRELRTLT